MSKEINMNIEVGDYVRSQKVEELVKLQRLTDAQYYITDRLNISDTNHIH